MHHIINDISFKILHRYLTKFQMAKWLLLVILRISNVLQKLQIANPSKLISFKSNELTSTERIFTEVQKTIRNRNH